MVTIDLARGVAHVGGGVPGVRIHKYSSLGDVVLRQENFLHLEGLSKTSLCRMHVAAREQNQGGFPRMIGLCRKRHPCAARRGNGYIGVVGPGAGNDNYRVEIFGPRKGRNRLNRRLVHPFSIGSSRPASSRWLRESNCNAVRR